MAQLVFENRALRAVNLSTARNRDVMELQNQSGMRLKKIAEMGKTNDIFALLVASFLSQHNAGIFVAWDDLLEATPADLGRIELTEAEKARAAEEEQEDTDPPNAPTPGDGDTAESPPATG
jgi:hypothetical protein